MARKTKARAPACVLYKYKCACGEEYQVTTEYDDDCRCGQCNTANEPIAAIPLYEEEPAAINLLRRIAAAWHRRKIVEEVNEGRLLVEQWDAEQERQAEKVAAKIDVALDLPHTEASGASKAIKVLEAAQSSMKGVHRG
jgi:hypothetical protein